MIKIRHFGFWKKPSHTIFIDKKYYFYAYDAFFFRLASTSFRRVLNIPSPIRYTLPQTPKLPHPSYLKGWGIKIEKTPQLFCTRYARLKLRFVSVAFALVTCCVPTSEFTTNEKQFNDLNTRTDSFYGKVLQQFGDHFGSRSSREIDRDLKSQELELKFGWVLGVIWAAPCFALAALLFFALSRLCVGRAKMKSSA